MEVLKEYFLLGGASLVNVGCISYIYNVYNIIYMYMYIVYTQLYIYDYICIYVAYTNWMHIQVPFPTQENFALAGEGSLTATWRDLVVPIQDEMQLSVPTTYLSLIRSN